MHTKKPWTTIKFYHSTKCDTGKIIEKKLQINSVSTLMFRLIIQPHVNPKKLYATWISQKSVFDINIEYESSIALISVNNNFSHIIYFKNTFKYINTDTYVQWCNCFDFFFSTTGKKQLGFQKHVSDMAYKHDQI